MRLRSDEIELPDGTIVPDYFVREWDGYVTILPLTSDERVVLVRQYRYPVDSMQLELPAGAIDPGEDPLTCARRELAEETGYEAPRFELAASYFADTVRSNAPAHAFVAFDARKTREPALEATEHLEVVLVAFDEFRRLLKNGEIEGSASAVAAYRALDYLDRL